MLKQGVEVTLSRGLEQWLWFLGLDVRHPSGNLLVKYGLKKFKSPNNDPYLTIMYFKPNNLWYSSIISSQQIFEIL